MTCSATLVRSKMSTKDVQYKTAVVRLCGGRLGGPDGCPEYGPEFWGHPISLERGGGEGGARHHGCSVHLSHEAGKQPCIWETDDCAIVSMAALAECLHLKSKKRAPQLTRRNAHIKLPDRQEDPCLAARSTGPLVVMGVRLRAVLRDSRRTTKVYVRFADPCKRHGQAEDAEPQQRSAGSCIPTAPGTEARPNLTKRSPCKVVLTAAGAPPWRGRRTSQAPQPHLALRQEAPRGPKRPEVAPRSPKKPEQAPRAKRPREARRGPKRPHENR